MTREMHSLLNFMNAMWTITMLVVRVLYSLEQVNNLREVQALRRLNPHPNIIELKEVVL